MRKMQVMVIKYGYATLEVDSEEEALEISFYSQNIIYRRRETKIYTVMFK